MMIEKQSFSQQQPSVMNLEAFQKKNSHDGENNMEKIDFENQHLPSYVALYANEIFEFLRNTEVYKNIYFLLYYFFFNL